MPLRYVDPHKKHGTMYQGHGSLRAVPASGIHMRVA